MPIIERLSPLELVPFQTHTPSSEGVFPLVENKPIYIVITTWEKGAPPRRANVGVFVWDSELRQQYRPPNDCTSRFPSGAILKTWPLEYTTNFWFDFIRPDNPDANAHYFALIEVYDHDKNKQQPDIVVNVTNRAAKQHKKIVTIRIQR